MLKPSQAAWWPFNLSLSLSSKVTAQPTQVPTITVAALAQRLPQQPTAQLVDVREAPELRQLPLHGLTALHIPLGQLPQQLHLLQPDQPLYLFCQAGIRSGLAQAYLRQHGFPHATNVLGGALAWAALVQP